MNRLRKWAVSELMEQHNATLLTGAFTVVYNKDGTMESCPLTLFAIDAMLPCSDTSKWYDVLCDYFGSKYIAGFWRGFDTTKVIEPTGIYEFDAGYEDGRECRSLL